jgi:5-methylcytosine-specific restriction endonuclease McrA
MTSLETLRDQVRQRAVYACEYCGVTEHHVGAQLTIDHYHPQVYGGANSIALP